MITDPSAQFKTKSSIDCGRQHYALQHQVCLVVYWQVIFYPTT